MSDKVVSIERKRRRGKLRSGDDKLIQCVVRLPEDLYRRIEATAQANYRTMVQETHMRLARDDAAHRKMNDADR